MNCIRAYLFLVRTFRNWPELVRNLRQGGYSAGGPILQKLVFWNGETIVHPPNRGGLAAILLEICYYNAYRLGDFYHPLAGDTVLDVGAHVGLFTLRVLRQESHCRVVAIEPSAENFGCLEHNVRRSTASASARTYQLAVGAGYGKVTMMDLPTNRSFDARTTLARAGDKTAADVVPLSRLLELAGADEVSLLKMDTEGAEYGAFATAEDEVLPRIQRLAMEYHDHLVPGTLTMLKERLAPTHNLEILPDSPSAHGRLFALRKDLCCSRL
jgi:FkbM family methyltransferase